MHTYKPSTESERKAHENRMNTKRLAVYLHRRAEHAERQADIQRQQAARIAFQTRRPAIIHMGDHA